MYSTVTQPERIQIIHSLPVPEDSGVKVEVVQPGPGEPLRSVLNLSWHARFQTLELATRPSVNDCPQDLHALPTSGGSLLRHLHDVATGYAALARPPVELEAPFMDFRAVSPNNISHLLQDIIPLMLHAQRVLGCKVTLLTRRIAPTFRELVEAFGIPIVDTSRRVRGIEVCAHACRRLTAYAPPWFDMPSLLFLPDIYRDWDFDAKESPESVFIARRGDRALKNHAEIEAMLVGLGFKTIYMEDYDARNKMGILKHTRRIVAVHGAGLAPAVFGRRLEQVVELMPPHAFNEWFASFLGAKVSDYKMVLSEHDPRMTRAGWAYLARQKSSAFTVNPDLLLAALSGQLKQQPVPEHCSV